MLRHAVSNGDERRRNRGCQYAGQFFSLFPRVFQTLNSDFVFAEIDALLFLEFGYQVVNDHLVKVVAAKLVVPAGCFYFEEAIAQFKNGNVECTAAKVIYQDGLVFGFLHAVSQCGDCRLVDDTRTSRPAILPASLVA